ncbi:hypothetical protein HOU03_gp388 [Caulobacter phage CcrSC]|uniref:Uncharacterized protein n=1 Tax=Caulobacter phage CcrSC TaxID=2283272 RepID=A0A385EDZ9_9CAUD|nr:hypothetical protein HOU03_gp388 [Caulobacter phage CcrSC]AXQ69880.1 hypothetical protein CcrSC_gp298 [Caulobacter phage CcrSC]
MLHNALGLLWAKEPYRRHYVVGKGSPAYHDWQELCRHGYGEQATDPVTGELYDAGPQVWFYVTEKGAALFGKSLPRD